MWRFNYLMPHTHDTSLTFSLSFYLTVFIYIFCWAEEYAVIMFPFLCNTFFFLKLIIPLFLFCLVFYVPTVISSSSAVSYLLNAYRNIFQVFNSSANPSVPLSSRIPHFGDFYFLPQSRHSASFFSSQVGCPWNCPVLFWRGFLLTWYCHLEIIFHCWIGDNTDNVKQKSKLHCIDWNSHRTSHQGPSM